MKCFINKFKFRGPKKKDTTLSFTLIILSKHALDSNYVLPLISLGPWRLVLGNTPVFWENKMLILTDISMDELNVLHIFLFKGNSVFISSFRYFYLLFGKNLVYAYVCRRVYIVCRNASCWMWTRQIYLLSQYWSR